MATVIANVTDCRSFWREIVVPDYSDFNAAIDNMRRAFHCAISLFHLCDWVYHAHKAYIDANFSYRDRNGVAMHAPFPQRAILRLLPCNKTRLHRVAIGSRSDMRHW